jgi:transcriptional regulator with XRE-family HTH domain
MTQAELVMSIGITQGYLSDLEAGKRKGPVALHQKIARTLAVPIHLLLPVAVSEKGANTKRFAKRRQSVDAMKKVRRRR